MDVTIDEAFRDAIASHPNEARSHFELVDPGVWRIDVSGRLSGLGDDWIGPYLLSIDGVEYDVYGLRPRISASQRQFLGDLGVAIPTPGLPKSKMALAIIIGICVLASIVIASMLFNRDGEALPKRSNIPSDKDWSEADELYARTEKRRIENHSVKPSAVALNDVVQNQSKQAMSIKERAREAFHASRWDEAIKLVNQLSDDEADAELRYYIGLCYKEGHSVEHDYAEAFHWFDSAAALGNAAAQFELGLAYEEGNSVPQDFSVAAGFYKKAASAGHAQAGYCLGKLYENGCGVEQSNSEACYWYKKSGELGNSDAMSAWQRLNGPDKMRLHPKK